jgi:hypothetical protein
MVAIVYLQPQRCDREIIMLSLATAVYNGCDRFPRPEI